MIKTLLAASLFCTGLAAAQSTVTIGEGTGSGTSSPIATWYESSASESIYTSAEIGTSGSITKVAFQKASGSSTVAPSIKIYLKATTTATLSASYSVGSLSGYTLVYEGSLPNGFTNGWAEVTLQTPYNYYNTKNLSVLVTGGTCIESGRPQYRYTTTSGSKMSAGYNDGSIGCGGNNPWTTSSTMAPVWERPNLKLTLGTLSTELPAGTPLLVYKSGNSIKIQSATRVASVTMYDALGRQLYNQEGMTATEHEVALTETNRGLLLVHVTDAEGKLVIKKIIN